MLKTVASRGEKTSDVLLKVMDIAASVREAHWSDIEMFYSDGHSIHDCYDISQELAELIKRGTGLEASVVSISPLLDYSVKHFAVLVKIGGKRYIVDAVPELTGLIPREEVLEEPLVGLESEYRAFFSKYLY